MSTLSSANDTVTASESATYSTPLKFTLGALRISLGWVFLWAFLDKTFGLGHETARADAWINGGSPTAGFLGHATVGPFADFYQSIAGNVIVNWLFMLGLLGIGVALVFGIGMRAAAVAGVVMLVMMWSAVLPPENNPFMDDHIIYALALVVLTLTGAGRFLGLEEHPKVREVTDKYSFLK